METCVSLLCREVRLKAKIALVVGANARKTRDNVGQPMGLRASKLLLSIIRSIHFILSRMDRDWCLKKNVAALW
jgi:hypothetical protein